MAQIVEDQVRPDRPDSTQPDSTRPGRPEQLRLAGRLTRCRAGPQSAGRRLQCRRAGRPLFGSRGLIDCVHTGRRWQPLAKRRRPY